MAEITEELIENHITRMADVIDVVRPHRLSILGRIVKRDARSALESHKPFCIYQHGPPDRLHRRKQHKKLFHN